MALYTITFTPGLGSAGTLIEFRVAGTTEWITPSAPANPTSLDNYPLYLDDGGQYDVRVSSASLQCTKKYQYLYINTVSTDGLNLFGKAESSAFLSVAQIYYSIDAGFSWNPTILATVGLGNTFMFNIVPTLGDDLYFAVRNNTAQDITFGEGDGGAFTGFCGELSPFHYGLYAGPDDVFFNLQVVANAFLTC